MQKRSFLMRLQKIQTLPPTIRNPTYLSCSARGCDPPPCSRGSCSRKSRLRETPYCSASDTFVKIIFSKNPNKNLVDYQLKVLINVQCLARKNSYFDEGPTYFCKCSQQFSTRTYTAARQHCTVLGSTCSSVPWSLQWPITAQLTAPPATVRTQHWFSVQDLV